MESNKRRIIFIDFLRGITMLLVIYSHIEVHLLHNTSEFGINSMLVTFRMPLFFFIMGYFLYSEKYDWELLRKRSYNRLLKQLYPTILFFLIFVIFLTGKTIVSQLYDVTKSGYWFTLVAVEYFFVIAPVFYLFARYRMSKKQQLLCFVTIALASKLLLELCCATPVISHSPAYKILSLRLFLKYVPYLLLGCIVKMYWEVVRDKCLNFWCVAIALGIMVLGFATNTRFTIDHIIPFCGIYVLFCSVSFLPKKVFDSRFGRLMNYTGTMTLEIYLLHYFVIRALSHWSLLAETFSPLLDTWLEFPAYLLLSFIISGGCLFLVHIFKKIRIYSILFPKQLPRIKFAILARNRSF